MSDLFKILLILMVVIVVMIVTGADQGQIKHMLYRATYDNENFQGSTDPQIDSSAQRTVTSADPSPYGGTTLATSGALSPVKHNTNVMTPPQMSNTYSPQPNRQDLQARSTLGPQDLLPKNDPSNSFNLSNPQSGGNLQGRNFLETGANFGIDTIGSSLGKNANRQIRSDPIVQKIPNISPWSVGTIDPDLNRRNFEIGSA